MRALKPYKLDSAIERLNKIAGAIAKLGKTMNIRISMRTTVPVSRSSS